MKNIIIAAMFMGGWLAVSTQAEARSTQQSKSLAYYLAQQRAAAKFNPPKPAPKPVAKPAPKPYVPKK